MRTETLIKDSAQVVKIVELSTGDVYKRLVKEAYSSETYKIKLGIVQDVISNGEQAALTALEFETGYGSVKPKIEVFADESELHLFAATPDEVHAYFDELEQVARRQLNTAAEALEQAEKVSASVSQARRISLSAPKVVHDVRAEITE